MATESSLVPDDKSVRVWDAKTGEQLRELQGHTDNVTSVAFSPDGNRIVSGSWDKSVRVWDAKTGEQLRELQGHTDYVNLGRILA
jgi:WD40 repeat protein